MSPRNCPVCGAVQDVLFGPTGDVQSCANCARVAAEARETQERTARKDEIDKNTLTAASRSMKKDAIELGAKIAGVLIGTAALFKSSDDCKEANKLQSEQDKAIAHLASTAELVRSETLFLKALFLPQFYEGQRITPIQLLRVQIAINVIQAILNLPTTTFQPFTAGQLLCASQLNAMMEPLADVRDTLRLATQFVHFPLHDGDILVADQLNELVLFVNEALEQCIERRAKRIREMFQQ